MKTNLFLIKYLTSAEEGTFEMKEVPSFFGSKMISIENNITIDDSAVQYSYRSIDGYQFYDISNAATYETTYVLNLNDLKQINHQILLLQQSNQNLLNNTNWQFSIDIKTILRTYLYAKIRERRTFRAIQTTDLLNKNLDNSIYQYIDDNMINRYKFSRINFYVVYENIEQNQTNNSGVKLQYNPVYDITLRNPANLITNLNIISDVSNLGALVFNYNQTKSSSDYRFNYYFDLFFSRI